MVRNLLRRLAALAFVTTAMQFAPAAMAGYVFDNGPGDGTVNVEVDGFGAFGSSLSDETDDAFYDPVGAAGPLGTTYESYVAIGWGPGPRTRLSSDDLPNPLVTADPDNPLRGTSTFMVGDLMFDLEQVLIPSLDSLGIQVGSRLDQTYHITNTGPSAQSFDLVRYMDGDIADFVDDAGGNFTLAGSQVLFETDTVGGVSDPGTFLGITANGGTTPSSNRFDIDEWSVLRDRIDAGDPLRDTVTNDNDDDGFIDQAYDVTMALRNEFFLAPGETAVWTTQTLWGDASPKDAGPGSSQTFPILPDNDEPPWIFTIDPPADETLWYDPVIAIGYDYEIVSGESFASVTLPTGINDPSIPYVVTYVDSVGNTINQVVGGGTTVDFSGDGGVDAFTITGIDPNLLLEPNDPLAFPTGLSFTGTAQTTFTMTPLTFDTNAGGGNPVPAPGAAGLLLLALSLLGVRKAARRAA